MWLLIENAHRSSRDVLHLVMSLGIPQTIGRDGQGLWGLHMASEQAARDAEWVLRRHPEMVHSVLGEHAHVRGVTDSPPAFTHVQNVRGRAEA